MLDNQGEVEDLILQDGYLWRSKLDKFLMRFDRTDLLRFGCPQSMLDEYVASGMDEVRLRLTLLWYIYCTAAFGPPGPIAVALSKPFRSLTIYRDLCADLTILIKHEARSNLRPCFLDIIALCGFLVTNDYDPTPELQIFSHELEYDRGNYTKSVFLNQVSKTPIKPRVTSTFRQWLSEGKYTTGGSSQLAKSEGLINGQAVKFKGQKSWIPIVREPDDLYDICRNTEVFVNTAGLKAELGKIRFFVGFDDPGYLIQKYILICAGKWYKGLWGITLDEDGAEEELRNRQIMKDLKGHFSLPFDYAHFDQQITNFELTAMMDFIISKVAPYLAAEDAWLISSWKKTTSNSVIAYNNQRFLRRHGLLSGQAVTSVIGNWWNAIWCQILFHDMPLKMWVRGDDTLIIGKRDGLVIAEQKFKLANIIGNELKYGIYYEESEFLKNTYRPNIMYGSVNRAISSVGQRKPWNEDSVEVDGRRFQCLKNYATLLLRSGVRNDKLAKKWVSAINYNGSIAAGFTATGGLQLYQSFKQYARLDNNIQLSARITPVDNYYDILNERYAEFVLTRQELVDMCWYQESLLLTTTIVKKTAYEATSSITKSKTVITSINTNLLSSGLPPFHFANFIFKKAKDVSRVRKFDPWKYTMDKFPMLRGAYMNLSRRGARKSEAISYLVEGNCGHWSIIPDRLVLSINKVLYAQQLPQSLSYHYLLSLSHQASLSVSLLPLMQSQFW